MRIQQDEPDGPVTGRALFLPGVNYHVRRHGLFWPARTLLDHGWHLTRAEWDAEEWGEDEDVVVRTTVGQLEEAAPAAPRTIVVGKSIGSLALPWAAERELAGIWLTPLLERSPVREALRRVPRSLLVGGTADESWQPDDALRERHEVVEIAGMNHGMFVGPGWRESFAAMAVILTAIDAFLDAQAARPS